MTLGRADVTDRRAFWEGKGHKQSQGRCEDAQRRFDVAGAQGTWKAVRIKRGTWVMKERLKKVKEVWASKVYAALSWAVVCTFSLYMRMLGSIT